VARAGGIAERPPQFSLAGITPHQGGTIVMVGLAVGTRIPEFQARDQHGNWKTFLRLRGPRGLAITFVRSADW